MFELLERLRTRPVHERQAIAMMVASVVTALIVLIWVLTLVYGMRHIFSPISQATSTNQSTSSDNGVFQSVFSDYINNSPERQRVQDILNQAKQISQNEQNGATITPDTLYGNELGTSPGSGVSGTDTAQSATYSGDQPTMTVPPSPPSPDSPDFYKNLTQ